MTVTRENHVSAVSASPRLRRRNLWDRAASPGRCPPSTLRRSRNVVSSRLIKAATSGFNDVTQHLKQLRSAL